MPKTMYKRIVILFMTIILSAIAVFAGDQSDDGVWREVSDSNLRNRPVEKFVEPDIYKTFRINNNALKKILDEAPSEVLSFGERSEVILTLPMPDGTFQKFSIKDSPIMEPALAAKFPELKTYSGQGIDDPTATTRFDITPNGFRAIVLSKDGTMYIEPYAKGDTTNYMSFNKADLNESEPFVCLFENDKSSSIVRNIVGDQHGRTYDNIVNNGTMLRTYRIAIAATGEYTTFHGGTVNGAMAAIMTTLNRVNGIYERELAIRMNLVANNNQIIYTNGNTDPYTNDDGGTLLTENQTNLDNVIGTANYDIGHVFSTGGGGVASLNSPCSPTQKAEGVTGSGSPQGDPFDVDFVSHEIGHQFGGEHTFNANTGSCAGDNRAATSAFETASGTTIQAYAGICNPQDSQRNSNDYFHVRSLEQMVGFVTNGTGTCSVNTATGNTLPTVTVIGGTTFNIPRSTPFALTASATDANNDNLTYAWEQYDLGPDGLPNENNLGPNFRSYTPKTSPTRLFPSLPYILNNANVPPPTYMGTSPTGSVCGDGATCITGEVLPALARTMNFQVTVRDNRAGGGGINSTTAMVNVDANSGPFNVTAPNTGINWQGNSQQTITWNVANTTNAPVNAANVKISLSTDGGQTFPTVISASTPNDGTEVVTIPNTATTTARIKVEAVGNIFFDISNANFTITAGQNTNRKAFMDFDGDSKTDIGIFRPGPGEWWYLRSTDNGNRAFQFGAGTDTMVPADFTGDGKTDIAFWRSSTGFWFVLRSEDNSFFSFPFGTNGDIPAPGDFDGDGKADAAVFRPANGTWYYIRSSDQQFTIQQFGLNGDVPIVKDYDGDGKDDIALWRPSVSEWYLNRSRDGFKGFRFGTPGDTQPAPADYTGDGKADIAFFRPNAQAGSNNWFVLRSEDDSFYAYPFGQIGDIPVPGDYDADGKADSAIYRPSNFTWYLQRTTAGFTAIQFGIANDKPIPASYIPGG